MNISSIMNTASSGMRAQTNRFAATANNVANLNTPGYSRIDPSTMTTDEGQPADLATEMELIKHPFRSGIKAQKGVEF